MRKLEAEESQKEDLEKAIDTAATKVVNKLLFCLRDNLDVEAFRDCVEAVAKMYE